VTPEDDFSRAASVAEAHVSTAPLAWIIATWHSCEDADRRQAMDGFPEDVILSPAAPSSGSGPGNMLGFMPQGFGLGAPAVTMPWGSPRESFYGFDKSTHQPILDSPTTVPSGGTIYFGSLNIGKGLEAALDLMGVRSGTDYVAFAASSENPRQDRYLDQLRLVSKGALEAFYKNEKTHVPAQPLDCA
jgi:hypothetical protein